MPFLVYLWIFSLIWFPDNSAITTVKATKTLEGIVKNSNFQPELIHPNNMEYDSLDDIYYIDEDENKNSLVRGKKHIKQWDHWGKWSDCSVSCGVGKSVRWRHCVSSGCAEGEKEAQIRTCTMKPCP
ncbi:hypothetical protein ABEB36_002982 [Hypothenemus hampei]|uniref:Uncharacterized protein n=1 Tax=Hypothenemus hampei TaxID=57062 RepID=A0ABD1F7L3_HYPHA